MSFPIISQSIENLFYTNESNIIFISIFLIIFIISFSATKKTILKNSEERYSAAIIAIAISLLATFYMSQSQILSILQTYNIIAYVLMFVLPFIITMAIIHQMTITSNFRKVMLLAFGAIFYYFSDKRAFFKDIPSLVSIGIILLAIVFDEQINKALKK